MYRRAAAHGKLQSRATTEEQDYGESILQPFIH